MIQSPTDELSLWIALSTLEPNSYGVCEERLKEIRKNTPEEKMMGYIEFANNIMDLLERNRVEALKILVDLILNSKPDIDKLNDIGLIQSLSSYIDQKQLDKLDKFRTSCLKGD